MAIDILADKLGVEFNKKGFKGVYGSCLHNLSAYYNAFYGS